MRIGRRVAMIVLIAVAVGSVSCNKSKDPAGPAPQKVGPKQDALPKTSNVLPPSGPTPPTAPTVIPTTPTAPTVIPTTPTAPTVIPTTPTAPTVIPTTPTAPTVIPTTPTAPTVIPTTPTAPSNPGEPGAVLQPTPPSTPGNPGTVQQPLELGNAPLAPVVVPAPQSQQCLQWKVVKRRVCRPKLRCAYVGGTCHTVSRCQRVPYTRYVDRQSCWQRPEYRHVTRRVCEPRWVVSNIVSCEKQFGWTTVTERVCRQEPAVRMESRRVCTPQGAQCRMQQVCSNTPTQVCANRPVRKLVRECQPIIRSGPGQKVCQMVRTKRMVPDRVCTRPGGPVCSNRQVCTMVTARKCTPLRKTLTQRQCSPQRTFVMQRRNVCQSVPTRRWQTKRVCTPSRGSCVTRLACGSLTGLCQRNPGDHRCRGCRRQRVCSPGRPICRTQRVAINVPQRRCGWQQVRVAQVKNSCRNVTRVVTENRCQNVPHRQCLTKRVCTGIGRPICKMQMVAKWEMVKQCTGNKHPMRTRQRCAMVTKVVNERQCRPVGQRRCTMQRVCGPGGRQVCRNQMVRVSHPVTRCRPQTVRRRTLNRVCRNVPTRRRLERCRMERAWTKTFVRQCANRRFSVTSDRVQCDPGTTCVPGREECVTVEQCRTRHDQVCAAW